MSKLNPTGATCRELRDYRPYWLNNSNCIASYYNIIYSTILLILFLHVLNKLVLNLHRALHGLTSNTVSISLHIRILEGLILWCVIWGLYCYLDIDDAASDASTFALVIDAVVYSLSAFFETVVLFLLCSSSIGLNAFKKSYFTSFMLSLLLLTLFVIFGVYNTRDSPPLFCINTLIGVRYILTSILYVGGLIYSRKTEPNRYAINRYVAFIVPCSLGKAFGRFMMAADYDPGFCLYDLSRLITYLFFPQVVYIALKRDSQYWTEDITKDRSYETDFLDETTKEELPNYADVVIPKTELYYLSKIEESPAGSLQLHVWRRKVVCVKVFQMDYLTRSSIQKFKLEANAMRSLRHDNIVRFMGVVIDPPDMGIVMEYCPNGDLFSILEKLRKKYDANKREVRQDSFASFHGAGTPSTSVFRTPSHALYQSLAGEDSMSSVDSAMLKDDIESKPRASFSPFKVMKEVARGMRYLHSKEGGRQAHRDLKSLNILLNDGWQSKIADFGECTNIGGGGTNMSASGEVGTPAWTAPEVLNHDRVSLKSDVFSFGIVMWEIMTWLPPTILLPQREITRQIKKKDEQLMKVIGNVFGVTKTSQKMSPKLNGGRPIKGGKGRDGRGRKKGGTDSNGKKPRSNSEDGGGRRRVKTEQLEDENDPHNRYALRESLRAANSLDEQDSTDVDMSLDSGMGWGGQDDMRVGRGKRTDVLIKFELNDEEDVRVLVAEKMYRPPLVKAPRSLVDLMQRCWSQDPQLRPSFSQIVSDLDQIEKANEGIDGQFPFEIANLVNYAADYIKSPLPPKPYSKQPSMSMAGSERGSMNSSVGGIGNIKDIFNTGSCATPRSSGIFSGGAGGNGGNDLDAALLGGLDPPISPNSARIYNKERS
ncbi:hypothetical protein TrLO_g12433 [Triparma laevis f. longispina]|uniref:Protein kinase domain-containing protein n=1 Tax=Triparma laevis f. longispina TaxID=1714387 RepID=A0A9W6ZU59_9STRA|nr:hypothetical protein TrLO_g12433 [Triparma laevis f. longispina]